MYMSAKRIWRSNQKIGYIYIHSRFNVGTIIVMMLSLNYFFLIFSRISNY